MKKMPRILFVGIFLFRTLRLSYIDTFKNHKLRFLYMSREHWHLFQQFQNKRYGMAPTLMSGRQLYPIIFCYVIPC